MLVSHNEGDASVEKACEVGTHVLVGETSNAIFCVCVVPITLRLYGRVRMFMGMGTGTYFTQSKLAVWFGNESRGVSDIVVERSESCISIPMFGMIESLNLATTTGIVLYEVTKQRREYQAKYKRANRKPNNI